MNLGRLLPNLLVGPSPIYLDDFEQLRSMEITAILSVQSEIDVSEADLELRKGMAKKLGLSYEVFPITDFDRGDLRRRLPACIDVLDGLIKAGNVVYLHCTAGVNRSPTIAAAFLHWKLGWPLDDALYHIRQSRTCCPDSDLLRALAGGRPE